MMKQLKTLFTLLGLFALVLPLLAQPDNPDPPTPLPGIAWLLAAGVALGAKRIYGNRQKHKS